METIRIEILNPKTRKLLNNLADLELIKIKKDKSPKRDFKDLVDKLRRQADEAPSPEEIIREVETVRGNRNAGGIG